VAHPVNDLQQLRWIRSPKGYYLTPSVHTRIGAPGGVKRSDLFPTHYRKSPLKLRLNRLEIRLLLPSEKAAPVVLHYELNVLHGGTLLFGTNPLSDLNRVERRSLSNVISYDPHRKSVWHRRIRSEATNVNLVGTRHIELHRILLRGRVHHNP
jgi:hypothetical protein